jgi:hypothetical protein
MKAGLESCSQHSIVSHAPNSLSPALVAMPFDQEPINLMMNQFSNTADVPSDHGNARGKCLEHDQRARLDPLRWKRKEIILPERLDDASRGNGFAKADS